MLYFYFLLFLIVNFSFIRCFINSSAKQSSNQVDYYEYVDYDYELVPNGNASNDLIIPAPEAVDREEQLTVEVSSSHDQIKWSHEDVAADTDLRDHDFIDNLMYVYYGSHSKPDSGMGSEIIIVGSVLSCAAQLLTIICALLHKNQNGKKISNRLFLNMAVCFCLANLLFMLCVYATKNILKCLMASLFLHYLHLLVSFWILVLCLYIYKRLSEDFAFETRYLLMSVYGGPAFLVLVCFAAFPDSYETRRFCFISVQKGMMFNYMIPVAFAIIATTFYALNGIRKINLELSKLELSSSESLKNDDLILSSVKKTEEDDNDVTCLRECKTSLKNLSVIQTSYVVVWFTSVLALENGPYSNIMPIFYSVFSCILSWYIFIRSKSFVPNIPTFLHPTYAPNVVIEATKDRRVGGEEPTSRSGSSDNIPLLDTLEAAYPEFKPIRHDSISTISS